MAPRFYDELAAWWPLFSPPAHYLEEAQDLLPRLGARPASRRATLLEDSWHRDVFVATPAGGPR